MHLKFAFLTTFAFYLLLFVGNENLRVEAASHDHNLKQQNDSNVQTYFSIDAIKQGTVIHTFFDEVNPQKLPGLLPRKVAESIPFSSNQLPSILNYLGIDPNSPQAKAMADTHRKCETPPMEGESIFCARSLESMLHFIAHHFWPFKLRALTTLNVSKRTARAQDFTIVGQPKEVPAHKTVACHSLAYPYTTYYCHFDIWGRRAFVVPLAGEDGDRIEAVAVCHVDTSRWDRDHSSFHEAGVEHGDTICHFFPGDNILWVPRLPSALM